MALTKTEITNRALMKIGEDAIQDFYANEENSVRASTIFDEAFEEVIGEGNWSSAIFRRKLPLIEVKDEIKEVYPEFTSFHPLPEEPKYTRIIKIFDYDDEYLIHENILVTRADLPLIIEYAGIPTSLVNVNIYLRASVIDRLAMKLALIISDKIKLFELLREDYYVNLQRNLGKDFSQSNRATRFTRFNSVIIRAGY